MRVGEGTRYLKPEELVFYMNSHERRMLIELRRIPGADGEGALDIPIHMFDRQLSELTERVGKVSIGGIDEQRLLLILKPLAAQRNAGNNWVAHVPLGYIHGVWESAGGEWYVQIDGIVGRAPPYFSPGRR